MKPGLAEEAADWAAMREGHGAGTGRRCAFPVLWQWSQRSPWGGGGSGAGVRQGREWSPNLQEPTEEWAKPKQE